jgi:hypothetical protein
MTPVTILHIAHSDHALRITEIGDNAGFKVSHAGSRTFTEAMKEMGWSAGQGWCNYWANSVWWRAYALSLPDVLLPIFRQALHELPNEKDSLHLWESKAYLEPLRNLGMRSVLMKEALSVINKPLADILIRPGSLVMFSCSTDDDNERGTEDHIGILSEVTPQGIICFEGNAGDALRMTYRKWSDEKVLGWILPVSIFPEWDNYELPT